MNCSFTALLLQFYAVFFHKGSFKTPYCADNLPLTKQQTEISRRQEVVMSDKLNVLAVKLVNLSIKSMFKVEVDDVPVDSLAPNLVNIWNTTQRTCR